MALTEVIGDVRRDGATRAQRILDEARAEAARITDAARERATAYATERQAQAQRDAAQVAAQVESHAEFEARKMVLAAEAELRNTLRTTVLDGFAALPKATRDAHLAKLLAMAKEVVGNGTVYGAKDDEAALKAQRTFKFGGGADIRGGIVVEAADGLTRLDLSYETLLADMWRDVLRQEAGLFG